MAIGTQQHDPQNALVLRSDGGGVARLTLNRPQALNSLSTGLMAALQDRKSVV